ncbi:MAG: alpha-L-fucosidase [Planctomycetota bacterium]|jgi:alpha-L-fucosidase
MTVCRGGILPLLLLIVTISFPCACATGQELQRLEYSEIVMGVKARIVLYAPDEAAGRRAARAAFERMTGLEAVMSDYHPDSELVQACRRAGRGPVRISDDLCRVLNRARSVSSASDGAFDVTVGPLVELWRQARNDRRPPDTTALELALARVGWRHMLVDPWSRTLELTQPDMQLDLGGIGKGFAADEALAVMSRSGVSRCLVDLGGDIAAGAPPPGADGWRVALHSDPALELTIADAAVATSGDTEQFTEFGARRYSHIIDPRTGMGLTDRTTVTVIGPDAATADALASAISVLGPVGGLELLQRFPGTSALVETHEGERVRRVSSEAFPLALRASGPDEPGDDRLDWWRAARFGMFIHWGLYAIPAGRWNGRAVPGVGEWIMYHGQIPVAEYEPLRERFDPARFDAGRWARMAKAAGMRYIVITTKHHDGFCLFDSEHTDYDVAAAPFGRDIMTELADACRREGIRIGWYHSIMDWHHPDYLPRRPWDDRPTGDADFDRYVAYLRGQVGELLANYGRIDVMWFDGEWESSWTHEHGRDLYAFVRGLQPDIIVNNRVDKGRSGMEGLSRPGGFAGDFGTPEQQIPPTGLPGGDWETCMTMNDSWGYKKDDHNWKRADELIRLLVDVASKGGNFLLNVGPTSLGEIPEPSVQRLEAIGAWMKTNGESIYATTASPLGRLPWGRCTQRAGDRGATVLYLHVFDWPPDGRLVVGGLVSEPRRAWLLSDTARSPLETTRRGDGVVITVPPQPTHPVDTVVVTARYESGGGKDNIGFWTDPGDRVSWTFELKRPGRFRVSIDYACAPGNGGGIFRLVSGLSTMRARIDQTGSWTDFRTMELGLVHFEQAGTHEIRVEPVALGGPALMNLKRVRLHRVEQGTGN